ncbi:MAG: DUF1549 domain-containing protein, partial [Verrucomicrobiales bacterium]|nr:DUF1549 domain-containing protein [Verrucomicrobiales bacterium]
MLTEEEKAWWSFQPVERPVVPGVEDAGGRVRSAIDGFVLRRLEDEGMGFAGDAEKRVLVRRLAIDLTGLPPSPAEVEMFLADSGEGSVERLVERLLASPHYGERWARHWLDVAGYADSEGADESDVVREWAYRYRDYVVRSLNSGKGFDEFIREQLAGDEMVEREGGEYSEADVERLEATGFLRMAADGTGRDGGVVAKNQVVADSLQIVSSSLLGMTMDCARCHDHRYDPISQADYFRMRAIFEPAFHVAAWKNPVARRVSLYTEADRRRAAEIEAEAAVVDKERAAKQEVFIAEVLEKELAKLEEPLRAEVRAARETAAGERTEVQKTLLGQHPSVNVSAGSLYLYNKAAADELKAMADKAGGIRGRKPKETFVRALAEVEAGDVPVTRVFYRGDPEVPRELVRPSGLTVLGERGAGEIAEKGEGFATTGRRFQYAQRLTGGEHPLVARVIVNRVWAAFFGRGLVETAGDFGVSGERPTHPELLD